jgi:hypothetical protein
VTVSHEKQNPSLFALLFATTGNPWLPDLAHRAFSTVAWFYLPAAVASGFA